MQNGLCLSVVVPAFNEAHRLPATLSRVVSFLAASDRWLPAEVIVVDDGSSDGTVAIVEDYAGAPGVHVRVWRQGENHGKGAAVRAGLAASRKRVLRGMGVTPAAKRRQRGAPGMGAEQEVEVLWGP